MSRGLSPSSPNLLEVGKPKIGFLPRRVLLKNFGAAEAAGPPPLFHLFPRESSRGNDGIKSLSWSQTFLLTLEVDAAAAVAVAQLALSPLLSCQSPFKVCTTMSECAIWIQNEDQWKVLLCQNDGEVNCQIWCTLCHVAFHARAFLKFSVSTSSIY